MNKTILITSITILLLIPIVVIVLIQGEEIEWKSVTVNEDYPELNPTDVQHLVELTKYDDPSLVNEYQELHQDIINWLADDSDVPLGLTNDLKIVGVGTMGSAALLITVDESNAHLIPEYKQVFETAYPHLNFDFAIVGDVTWSVDSAIHVNMTDNFEQNNLDNLIVTDIYEKAYNELALWWDDKESVPSISNLPINAIGVKYGETLFIGVDEDNADQIDIVQEKLQEIHPTLNIFVGIVGDGEWASSESVYLPTNTYDK